MQEESGDEDTPKAKVKAAPKKPKDEEEDDAEEEGSDVDGEDGEPKKAKGVESLIEIENPNRAPKKVSVAPLRMSLRS